MEYSHHIVPKVSIVVPTKNRCLLLLETVESIRKQTYSNWEAIVVDDGSTDGTIEQMLTLSKEDPRIRFMRRSSTRFGAPACRNEGVDASTGDYIIFLDSDDCLAPFCLENRVEAMRTYPSLDFGVFPCQLFQEEPGDMAVLWNAETQENDIDRFLTLDVPWQTTSPIWRRQALTQLGAWDESLLSWQDWEFHLRALIKGLNCKKFSEPDCFWRIPNHKSIGMMSLTPEHLRSHERLLSKLHCMLSQVQLLDTDRQVFLASLYFLLAHNWASLWAKTEAARVWTVCRNTQLIGSIRYWEGLFYFMMWGIRLAGSIGRKYLVMRWPEKLLLKHSCTFRNTHITPDEELCGLVGGIIS